MANYNAQIDVNVRASKALASVKKIENALSKLSNIDVKLKGLYEGTKSIASTDYKDAIRSYRVLKGTVTGLGRAVSTLVSNFKSLAVGVSAVAAGDLLNQFFRVQNVFTQTSSAIVDTTSSVLQLAAAQPVLTAGVAATTTALIAFGPQLERVGARLLNVGKLAARARVPLQELFNQFLKSDAFNDAFADVKDIGPSQAVIEQYRRTLYEISETVSELSRRKTALTDNLNRFNSTSDTAQKIATKLVDVQKRLNAETEQQAILLRAAARAQRDFNDQARVRGNIAKSQFAREGSGFASFSQAASRVEDKRAIEKAIRRNRERLAKRAQSRVEDTAPLMLPSAEMLRATERGIKRIRTGSAEVIRGYNKGIDLINQNASNFVKQLQTGSKEVQRLPRIFDTVAQSLDTVKSGYEAVVRNTRQQAKLLRENEGRKQGSFIGPLEARAAGLKKLAALERKLLTETAELRERKELKSFQTAIKALNFRAKKRKKEAAEAAKIRSQRNENLLLGAGFPLVTGGGLGSVVGGAAGALLQKGGGFGLGVFLSGVGQKLDQFVQSQAQVASSIQSTTDVFGALESAGFKVSGALKATVQRLEQAGDTTGAYRLKLLELQKAYGANAVRDLNAFDRGNQRIADSFKRLTATLFPPLIRLFTAMSYVTSGVINNLARFVEFLTGPSAQGGNVRPDFRLAGEFASAGAFERELADRPLVSKEEQNLSTFKQSNFYKQYEKGKQALEESRSIVDSINRRQKEAEDRRSREREKVRRYEFERRKLVTERARIEADSLRHQLKIQSQIRDAEAKRLSFIEKGQKAAAAANVKIIEAQVEAARLNEPGFDVDPSFLFTELKKARVELFDKTEYAQLSSALADAAGSGGMLTAEAAALLENYRNSVQFLNRINAEEQTRLFITKDDAYQKRTNLINAEVEILNAATEQEANRLRLVQLQNEAREQAKQEGITDPALVEKRVQAVTAKFTAQNKKVSELTQFITQATDELNNLEATAVRVAQGIGDAIGSSLANGISRLIEGSAQVRDVFADLLKTVGQILVQEGTKMIATYIAIGIAKAFAGLGSNSFGSAKPPSELFSQDFTSAFMSGAGLRATGGPVERNRTYMVGEQGPELFTPNQAGRISSANETRSLLGRSPVGGAPAMNFTFETTNIGGQEYVSREQLEAAMAVTRKQAANDGASKGMSMTLDKMQHSPATRRRVGIG